MNWFRIFLVAAVICATVAIGVWGTYVLLGVSLGEGATVISLVAGFAALVLGGSAAVSAATRSER